MTSQNLLQGRKQRQSQLAQGREVASDAAKIQSPTPTAETAGDLLLHLDHTNIALGLRVVKRNTQIPYKGQHRLFVLDEAVKQIARRALLAPPAPFGGRFVRGRGRIGLLSPCQHLPIPAEHMGLQSTLQFGSSSGSGPVGQAKKGQQQAPHLRRPDLPGRFWKTRSARAGDGQCRAHEQTHSLRRRASHQGRLFPDSLARSRWHPGLGFRVWRGSGNG